MARQIINLGASAGDHTGDTARAGGQKINDNFEEVYGLIDILTRIDIISDARGFSIAGTDVTVNADWQWYINNELYTNPAAVVLLVALSSAGMLRKVYVVPNDTNGFDLIEGDEAASNPPTPELPNGGMYVTFFEVSDSGIGTAADPYNGDNLINKLDKGGYEGTAQTLNNRIDSLENYGRTVFQDAWIDVDDTGVVSDLNLSTTESLSLNFIGTVSELQSIVYDSGVVPPYRGSVGFIKNSQAIDILIPHEELGLVSGRFVWRTPDEQDLVLKPKQILIYKTNGISSGYLEVVTVSNASIDESNLMHLDGDETIDGNKTFLQPVSGEDGTNPEHLVTKAQLDLKLDASAYNDRYKGKYTSLGALETAHPTANSGDYAQVDAGSGSDVVNYNWDAEEGWVVGSSGSGATDTDALPEGSTNFYFTESRVLATVLSGLSAVAGTFTATDSILTAMGKIKYLIENIATTYQAILVSGTNIRTVGGESLLGSGNVPVQITITTTTSVTNATNDASGWAQNGKNVIIDNGVNAINYTINGAITASFVKHGTGAITFVQGSGRTLVQVDGTAVLNGSIGSTATISSVGTTDYLRISNA